jgi:hypothetical protein
MNGDKTVVFIYIHWQNYLYHYASYTVGFDAICLFLINFLCFRFAHYAIFALHLKGMQITVSQILYGEKRGFFLLFTGWEGGGGYRNVG